LLESLESIGEVLDVMHSLMDGVVPLCDNAPAISG
jgi:hypothetical protein